MKLKLRVLAVVVLSWVGGFGQTALSTPPNSIYVGADGKYEAEPDTAIIQFNISAQENSSQAAYDRASRAGEEVRKILRNNGIDPKTAEIGYFSLEPVYDYHTPKHKIQGYRVNTVVTLKLKDFAKIAPIVQQLSDIDVTADQLLNYTLEQMDAAKAQAVEDAIRRARAMATAAALASGRAVGELSSMSVDVFQPVLPIRRAAVTAAPTRVAEPAPTAEFTPQKVTITAHVNALFLLK